MPLLVTSISKISVVLPKLASVVTLKTGVSVPGISYILGYPRIVEIAAHFVGCNPYSKSASSIDTGIAARGRSIASVPKSKGLVVVTLLPFSIFSTKI